MDSQGIPLIFKSEVIILKWKGRNFSSLPQDPVKGPSPNEKYSKIIQNSQNVHSNPFILIHNTCMSNLESKGCMRNKAIYYFHFDILIFEYKVAG